MAAIILLAGLFIVLSWRNSLMLQSVSICIKEGVKENFEPPALGFNAPHQLPDYRVKLKLSGKFLAVDLGTKLDTSATNWLEYPVSDVVPVRRLQEVIVIEEDKLASDILERVQGSGPEMEGANFKYRLATARSFEVGLNWFFSTTLGKAIAIGIVIGLVLLIGQLFRR